MQDKVSRVPPPEIRMVEGKPPPNSWVSENIVKHYQIQSQVKLLTDVVSYMQELQSQQLAQVRGGKSLPLREAFVPLPEKGSPSDISNNSTFNAMQGYIKIQITYLERLVYTLKAGDSQLHKRLDPFLEQLKLISQSFPHLDTKQLESLTQLMEQLLKDVKQTPLPTQRIFWNQQQNMLQNLMSQNGSNIKDFQQEIHSLKTRSKLLRDVGQLLQNIQNTLTKQAPNREELLQLVTNLQNLANQHSQMNPSQNNSLAKFFEQLGYFKNSKGIHLAETVADTLIQTKLSQFFESQPNGSKEDAKNFLSDYLKQSNLLTSSLPFTQSVGVAIEDVLDKSDFPGTQSHSGIHFSLEKEGAAGSAKFFDSLLSDFAPQPHSVAHLKNSVQFVSSQLSEEMSENAIKEEGYQGSVAKLSTVQNIFGKSALWTIGQSLQIGHPTKEAALSTNKIGLTTKKPSLGDATPNDPSESNLPWNFEQAILNHYMPGQEAYLRDLAMVLYLDNNGANFGNSLLEKMMGFDGASNTFSFSNWLHSTGVDHNFSGSLSKARAQWAAEVKAVSNAIDQIKSSLDAVTKELQSIGDQLKNKDLTPDQKQILENQQSSLETLQKNLLKCYNPEPQPTGSGSLVDLQNEMSTISINPPNGATATSGSAFSISSSDPKWQSNLSNDEGNVINGNPKDDPPGGLINVQAAAQNFQQTYSDQGQNQQMILQMRMTEIQQEWTVVSTSLQLLFQMYGGLAQSIYK